MAANAGYRQGTSARVEVRTGGRRLAWKSQPELGPECVSGPEPKLEPEDMPQGGARGPGARGCVPDAGVTGGCDDRQHEHGTS